MNPEVAVGFHPFLAIIALHLPRYISIVDFNIRLETHLGSIREEVLPHRSELAFFFESPQEISPEQYDAVAYNSSHRV